MRPPSPRVLRITRYVSTLVLVASMIASLLNNEKLIHTIRDTTAFMNQQAQVIQTQRHVIEAQQRVIMSCTGRGTDSTTIEKERAL